MNGILKQKYLIIAVTAFLTYSNMLSNGYVWDDQITITENKLTKEGLSGLKEIWTSKRFIEDREIYRPVPQTLFAIEWHFFPNNPYVAHLVSLLLFVAICLVLLKIFLIFFPESNPVLGLIAVLFFAVAPVHVEAVSNIKSTDELLSALFVLLAILVSSKKGARNIFFSIILFALSLLSKISSLSVLPLLVWIWYKNKQELANLIKPILKYYIDIWQLSILVASLYMMNTKPLELVGIILICFLSFTVKPKHSSIKNNLLILGIIIGSWLSNVPDFFAWTLYISFLIRALPVNLKEDTKRGILFLLTPIVMVVLKPAAIGVLIPTYLVIWPFFIIKNKALLRKLIVANIFLMSTLMLFMHSKMRQVDAFYIIYALLLMLYFAVVKRISKKSLIKSYIFLALIGVITFIYLNPSHFSKAEGVTQEHVTKEQNLKNVIYPYHNILQEINNPVDKAATILKVQTIYFGKLIFPKHLIHQYGVWQIKPGSFKSIFPYIAVLIYFSLIVALVLTYKRKKWILFFPIIWFLLSMFVYTNIFYLMPDTLAERFMFLPSLAFYFIVVFLVYEGLKRIKKEQAITIIFLPLFFYFIYKTTIRNKDWKSNYTLAANTLPFAESNASINAQYAVELNNKIKLNEIKNIDSAEYLVVSHYKKAIEIYPDFYGPNSDLASFYILKGDPNKAYPYLLKARDLRSEEWTHSYFLGLIHYERKEYNKAIKDFSNVRIQTKKKRVSGFKQERIESYEYEARCLYNLGKMQEAIKLIKESIDIFDAKTSYILLGNLYRLNGQKKESLDTFKTLQQKHPNDKELTNTIKYIEQS